MQSKSEDGVGEKLTELVESAVTSGKREVDPKIMKEIKSICRVSDDNIEECYKILIHQLSQKHSEIREAAFAICCELFQRSHRFRESVADDFRCFSELVFGHEAQSPLPPPKAAAKRLKATATRTIRQWYGTYGSAYKKLRIGFEYLKRSRAVDFEDADAAGLDAAEQDRRRANEAKERHWNERKLDALTREIEEKEAEVRDCVTQIENGLALLVPDPAAESRNCPPPTQGPESEQDLREHGIGAASSSLIIEVRPLAVRLDDDNDDVVRCVAEQLRLLTNRFRPAVLKWSVAAAKLGADQRLLRRVLDLKADVDVVTSKCNELQLESLASLAAAKAAAAAAAADGLSDGSDSDDSDLESVVDVKEKVGYEATVRPFTADAGAVACGSTRSSANVMERRQRPAKKSKSLSVKSFDIDSYRADSTIGPTMSMNQVESYWVSAAVDESGESSSWRTADLLTQHIELSEEFDPVKWACRAPLPSGKLCPRRDRVKCPLHGLVVARDCMGRPVDGKHAEGNREKADDWQDPALLAEIKAATGVDLKMPEKGKRLRGAKRSHHPNLTDIKALDDTARNRIEKKIFRKSVVKRVASAMDSADRKQLNAKFGDQFNYAYQT